VNSKMCTFINSQVPQTNYNLHRLRNDLLCIEWDVKPHTLTHNLYCTICNLCCAFCQFTNCAMQFVASCNCWRLPKATKGWCPWHEKLSTLRYAEWSSMLRKRSRIASESVYARFQVSVCSSYNLCPHEGTHRQTAFDQLIKI